MMKHNIFLVLLVSGICLGHQECPKNREEKVTQCSAVFKELGRASLEKVASQSLCRKLYDGVNCMVDIMKACPEIYKANSIDYRKFRLAMYRSLLNICPPVGLTNFNENNGAGSDCKTIKATCARLASQAYENTGDQVKLCRSLKPTTECSLYYAKTCMNEENDVFKTTFASYVRSYVSDCRDLNLENKVTSPPSNAKSKKIKCERLDRKCIKIASKANVRNCSIMKKSFKCRDDYYKLCRSFMSKEMVEDYKLSRSEFSNQCSTGDEMIQDYPKQASGLSVTKCQLLVAHCSDMIVEANSEGRRNCKNAVEIKGCLKTVIDRCSASLDSDLIGNLKTTYGSYTKCLLDPCPNPVLDYEKCEDMMNGIDPHGLCKKGRATLRCYKSYMKRCKSKMNEYMKGGVTSFRKLLNDNNCI